MANVTIPGVGGGPAFTIPFTTLQSAQLAQQALAAIAASIAAAKAVETSPTVPATINLAAGSSTTFVGDNGTAPLTVNDASSGSVTVLSGIGGLRYDAQNSAASPAANVLVIAGGGPSFINLGFGTATVSADGVATVNALNGGDLVFATTGGTASVNAGAGAVVYVAGNDTVGFRAPNAKVFTQNGANLEVIGTGVGSIVGPVVGPDSGNVTISALGAFTTFNYVGLGGNLYVDASAHGNNVAGNAGGIIINPVNTNVTVFAGAGFETLYGTGDAGGTAVNNGSDQVNSGNGFFHGGTGRNVLETSSVSGAATLQGGSRTSTDALYLQGAFNTAMADFNTTVIDASGLSGTAGAIANFTFIPVATDSGEETLDARTGKQVSIFGAAAGANTIMSGTGSGTVMGSGVGFAAHASPNVFVDGVARTGLAGGSIVITDFVVGWDKIVLNGSTVTNSAIVNGSATFTMSDSTKFTLLNVTVTDLGKLTNPVILA